MKHVRTLLLICLSLLVVACSSGGGSSDSAATACEVLNLKVVNGDKCNADTSPVLLVIAFDNAGTPLSSCTGTLIAPTKVLTAAHCIVDSGGKRFVVASGNEQVTVSNAAPHPAYRPVSTASNLDVAVLTLSRSLPYSPVPLLLSHSASSGDRATVYGYGNDENGQGFSELGFEAFKATFVRISEIKNGIVVTEFDDTQTGACAGDSGGPLVVEKDGATGIVAVVQGGTTDDCKSGTLEVFTHIQSGSALDFVTSAAPEAAVS